MKKLAKTQINFLFPKKQGIFRWTTGVNWTKWKHRCGCDFAVFVSNLRVNIERAPNKKKKKIIRSHFCGKMRVIKIVVVFCLLLCIWVRICTFITFLRFHWVHFIGEKTLLHCCIFMVFGYSHMRHRLFFFTLYFSFCLVSILCVMTVHKTRWSNFLYVHMEQKQHSLPFLFHSPSALIEPEYATWKRP